MTGPVSFFVLGHPASQPRPRMTRTGRAYNPPSADAWKACVRAAWSIHGDEAFGDSGLRLGLEFVMPRPAAHWTSKGVLRSSAPVTHRSKPDLDNLAKAVMDALENAGAFANDCAVQDLRVLKRYGRQCETPGCWITISQND